jgi:WD40 repeat protein
VACNPRGDMVATISLDRTLRLWELNQGPAQSRTTTTPTYSPMSRAALVRSQKSSNGDRPQRPHEFSIS